MNILKIIIIALLVGLLARLIRQYLFKPTDPKKLKEPGNIVPCAHCAVHIPEKEAVEAAQEDGSIKYFCSEEHKEVNSKQ